MIGLSTSGSISLGCALVAGRKRVPRPAAGKTALRTMEVTDGIVAERRLRAGIAGANRTRGLHARSRIRSRSRRRRPRRGCATAASTPTRRSRKSRRSKPPRRRLIPEVRGPEAPAEHVGRRDRPRQTPGPGHDAVQEANRLRAQQIKQLGIQLDSHRAPARRGAADAAEPAARERAGRATSAAENVEVRRHGEPRAFDFEPKPHWELGPGARHHRLRARHQDRRRSLSPC